MRQLIPAGTTTHPLDAPAAAGLLKLLAWALRTAWTVVARLAVLHRHRGSDGAAWRAEPAQVAYGGGTVWAGWCSSPCP
jgi:hypothetical protein